MVDEKAIKFIATKLGGWYYKEKPHCKKGRLLYCYQSSDKKAETILYIILHELKVKQKVAQTVLELRKLQAISSKYRIKITGYRNIIGKYGQKITMPNLSFSDEYVAMCESLYQKCKILNKVGG